MIETFRIRAKRPARLKRTVRAASIAKVRNPLLAAQIQAEASVEGALAAQQSNLQSAGACLKKPFSFSAESNGLDGLDASLSNLFEAFQKLSIDPANLSLRRIVVRSAWDVTGQFNSAALRLNSVTNDLNASIQTDVAQANQNLRDIARLNKQIMATRASGATTVPLARQRERLLESLSVCVNITVAPQVGGIINVSIGGVTMVCGAKTPDCLAACSDKDGNFHIQAQKAGTRLEPAGGSIAGKITARDGALAGLRSGLNTLAAQLITRVNAIYNAGCELNGGKDRMFFTGTGASDIGVNNTVAQDPSRLPADAAALALANLGGRNVPDLGNQTFVQSYTQTVSALDNTLSTVNDDLSSSQAVTQMLAHERDAAPGASLDAEATDLQQYEQACAVSAKVITTLDEVLPMR